MTRLFVLVVAGAILATAVAARGADDSARPILERWRDADGGGRRWTARQATLQVTVIDRSGASQVSELRIYQRRAASGRERSTAAFVEAPAAAKGTAFLAVARDGQDTELWLYEPERRETQALRGEAAGRSAAGSDLTFHDLDLLDRLPFWTDADATATLRGEENVDEVAAHAIELAPRRADVGYRKIVVWIGRDDLLLREVALFGDEGTVPNKRIRITQIRNEGAVPWAESLEVENPRAGTRTRIAVSDVRFNPKLGDALFTPAALERGAP